MGQGAKSRDPPAKPSGPERPRKYRDTGTALAAQAVFRGVLNQNRNVVPYPPGIKGTVLLLDDVFDVFPWNRRVPNGEPVHDMG